MPKGTKRPQSSSNGSAPDYRFNSNNHNKARRIGRSNEHSVMSPNPPSGESQEDTQMGSNDQPHEIEQSVQYLAAINYDVSQSTKDRYKSLQTGIKRNGIDHMEYILANYKRYYETSDAVDMDLLYISHVKSARNLAQKLYSEDYTTALNKLIAELKKDQTDDKIVLKDVYRAVIYDLLPNKESDEDITQPELDRIDYLKATYDNDDGVYKPRHSLATIRILEDYTEVLQSLDIDINVNNIQSGQFVKAYNKGIKAATQKRWFNGRIFYIHDEIKESVEKNFFYGVAYEDGYYEDAHLGEIALDQTSAPVTTVPKTKTRIYVLKFEYNTPSYLLQLTKAIKNEFNKAGYMSGIRPMLEKYHASHTTMPPFMFLFDAHLNYLNYESTKDKAFAAQFKAAMALFKDPKIAPARFDYPGETALIRYNTSTSGMADTVTEYNKKSKALILYRYDPTDRKSPGFPETTPVTTHDYVVQYLFNPASAMIRSRRPEHPFIQAATETTRLFMRPDAPPLIDRPTAATLRYTGTPAKPTCCCYLCGKTIAAAASKPNDPIYGQLDHLIPVVPAFVLGILDAPMNYAPTHKKCNTAKNASIPEGAPISPDFFEREYNLLLPHIQTLLQNDDSIRSDVADADATDNEPSYDGGGTPVRPTSARPKPVSAAPSTPRQSAEAARPSASPSPSPLPSPARLAPISVKVPLKPAREAADVLFKEIRAILTTPPGNPLSFAAILRLFLSHELFNFYNAILMINAPSSGAPRSRSQSGGTPEVLNARLADFFSRFNPNDTGAEWAQNDRKAFIYARYNALYQFSLKYFEYQKTRSATTAASYIAFIIDRMAAVLSAKANLSEGAGKLAI